MLSPKTQDNLLIRLNRIQGQIQGIRKMVEKPRYCPQMMNQIAAVRRALDSVSMLMLEDHMNTCVTNAIKKNKGKAHIKELLSTIDRFVR